MDVHQGAYVLVTDGCKALLLQNEGDAEFPDLRLVHKWEQSIDADHELKSGASGRAFSSHDRGTRRSSYQETDFHDQAEVRFAAEVVEFLATESLNGSMRELIIVAPPRTLGEVRKRLSAPMRKIVTAQIPKDLVKHPITDIERLLACYSETV